MSGSYAADLHIHSCLSPCGDMEMTPNNLVNMAYLKGLDIIALTDHNSTRNLRAASAVAKARGILFIPGVEAESVEEVHVLCYMPCIEAAEELGGHLYAALPDIKNRPKLFGEQIAMNEDDEPIYNEERLLIQSTRLSIDDIVKLCRQFGGVPVPAHVNRTSNSIINSLGFIPPSLDFSTIEVYDKLPMSEDVSMYRALYSSDAHMLDAINEREKFISLDELSVESFLKKISRKRQ